MENRGSGGSSVQILCTQMNTNIVPVPFLTGELSRQRGKAFPNPAARLQSLGWGYTWRSVGRKVTYSQENSPECKAGFGGEPGQGDCTAWRGCTQLQRPRLLRQEHEAGEEERARPSPGNV